MLDKLTSVEPKANVSSAGLILFKKGQINVATPKPPIDIEER